MIGGKEEELRGGSTDEWESRKKEDPEGYSLRLVLRQGFLSLSLSMYLLLR